MVRGQTVPSHALAAEQENTARRRQHNRRHEAHPRGSDRRRLTSLQVGAIGHDYNVEEHMGGDAEGGSPNGTALIEVGVGDVATPPKWDSTLCMQHWGLPELQTEPDPRGYIIFVNGRLVEECREASFGHVLT